MAIRAHSAQAKAKIVAVAPIWMTPRKVCLAAGAKAKAAARVSRLCSPGLYLDRAPFGQEVVEEELRTYVTGCDTALARVRAESER